MTRKTEIQKCRNATFRVFFCSCMIFHTRVRCVCHSYQRRTLLGPVMFRLISASPRPTTTSSCVISIIAQYAPSLLLAPLFTICSTTHYPPQLSRTPSVRVIDLALSEIIVKSIVKKKSRKSNTNKHIEQNVLNNCNV